MLYKIRCNPVHTLNGALPGPYVPARVTRGTLMHSLVAEPCSTAGLLFPSRCPCGIILLIQYSMVWDWRPSRVGLMIFYQHKLLYPFSIFPFLFVLFICSYCGAGSLD